MELKIKRLKKEAILPCYNHDGDAGLDLFCCENRILKPGERYLFSTGITCEMQPGFAALVWDRSGLAAKHGVTTLGGVIDAHYRGEYKVALLNTSDQPIQIKKGDRIAQMLIQPVQQVSVVESEVDMNTARGANGFGSSGR